MNVKKKESTYNLRGFFSFCEHLLHDKGHKGIAQSNHLQYNLEALKPCKYKNCFLDMRIENNTF